MEISPRAHLANVNKSLEAAAPIIVADWLRTLVKENNYTCIATEELADLANELDPR